MASERLFSGTHLHGWAGIQTQETFFPVTQQWPTEVEILYKEKRKGTLHWDTFLIKVSTLHHFTPCPQGWKEFVHSLNTGDKEKFCPMEVLGGLTWSSDATFGDKPAHGRKGRHSSHYLMEHPLDMDGKEAVAATLVGSASIGAA